MMDIMNQPLSINDKVVIARQYKLDIGEIIETSSHEILVRVVGGVQLLVWPEHCYKYNDILAYKELKAGDYVLRSIYYFGEHHLAIGMISEVTNDKQYVAIRMDRYIESLVPIKDIFWIPEPHQTLLRLQGN